MRRALSPRCAAHSQQRLLRAAWAVAGTMAPAGGCEHPSGDVLTPAESPEGLGLQLPKQ
jgi:hypothetical protein